MFPNLGGQFLCQTLHLWSFTW